MPVIIILACILIEHVSRYLFRDFITLSYNPGVALDILRGNPGLALIFSGIACVIIIFACIFLNMNKFTRLGLAIMTGGALSNLLERIFLGYVIDWIPMIFIDYNCNLADVEISLGALIAVWPNMKQLLPRFTQRSNIFFYSSTSISCSLRKLR